MRTQPAPTITLSLPELQAVINDIEHLSMSREPRGPYEEALTDQILALAKVLRMYLEQV